MTFPQVALTLTKADGSDVVTAAYAVGVFSSLADIPSILVKVIAQTDAGTDVFTPANPFVLPGFEAIDPVTVPEPPSLLLLFSGLLGPCRVAPPGLDCARRGFAPPAAYCVFRA